MKVLFLIAILVTTSTPSWARLPEDPNRNIGLENKPQATSTAQAALDMVAPFGDKDKENSELTRNSRQAGETLFNSGQRSSGQSGDRQQETSEQ